MECSKNTLARPFRQIFGPQTSSWLCHGADLHGPQECPSRLELGPARNRAERKKPGPVQIVKPVFLNVCHNDG
uniref:Uncharacterized protein n=1 Tax=Romanomermis culicivorax TaxID=13658 RepID=A0A915J280_ROMCU